jgi:hypothetical protein
MSLTQFSFLAKTIDGFKPWFVDIYNHLCRKNYANGTWVPTITGMTGTPTVSASFQRFGKTCTILIKITGAHTMSDATVSLSVASNGDGCATIIDCETGGFMGTAQIGNTLTIKSLWISSGSIVIIGSYPVIGI